VVWPHGRGLSHTDGAVGRFVASKSSCTISGLVSCAGLGVPLEMSAQSSLTLDHVNLQDLSLHAAILLDIAHPRLESCITLFGEVTRIRLRTCGSTEALLIVLVATGVQYLPCDSMVFAFWNRACGWTGSCLVGRARLCVCYACCGRAVH
jgi:hypothetical protein